MQPREFDRPLEPHHRDGSLVVDALYNPGYLKDVTTYGAMFHPLDLSGVQREKAINVLALLISEVLSVVYYTQP